MALTVDNNGTPIVVTGTTDVSQEVVPANQSIYVKFIYWYNITTSGHLLSIKDGNGRIITTAKCQKDGDYELLPIMLSLRGIFIDDMDSGTLYIYHP